jgi:hydrogenase maturation protease
VLVGGVGYTCLRDLSIGPLLVERLAARSWPEGVVVEDLSYGPIDVLFRLQGSPPFDAAIFVTAVGRGRAPGTLDRQPWRRPEETPDELQARIAEAVTGVVSLDNLLVILAHFGALPPRVTVLEVEPATDGWGTALSEAGMAALERAEAVVRDDVRAVLLEARVP